MRRGRAGNFSWGPFVGMFKWNDSISMLDGEGGGGVARLPKRDVLLHNARDWRELSIDDDESKGPAKE